MLGIDVHDVLIKILQDRIENWEKCLDGSLLVKPKRANFDELVITTKKIFADTEYNFIASINFVKDQKSSDEVFKNIGKIGVLVSQMKWERKLFTNKPVFVTLRLTKQPRENQKGLRTDFELATILNSKEKLIRLIQKLRPSELSVTLLPLGNLDSSTSAKDRTGSASSHSQPTAQISWLISLGKILYRSPGYPGTVRTIFDVLDAVSGLLRNISKVD